MINIKHKRAIEVLYSLAKQSTCTDGHVAAIIMDPEFTMVYATGVNGGTKSTPCLCNLGDKYTCVHAEINALMDSRQLNFHRIPAIMLCTKAPCVSCAGAIINAGISAVYFCEKYKYTAGIKLLLDNNIAVYALNYLTK